ncbi:MAG: hypothetical protein BGO45_04355 [Microbacterium sp. 71-36]|nr:MAG: hypothetical protein ABS60_13865 [Microbacterium sp. SCN 71-17]OJV75736.1 MAG: hypothetical protein BGO45_04355 [Microbacterium sp. 71-36]
MVVAALIVGFVAPAQADDPSPIDLIAGIAPEVLEGTVPVEGTPSGQQLEVASVGSDVAIEIPVDPSDAITLADGVAAVSIELPATDESQPAEVDASGLVSYDMGDGSSTVLAVKADGSIQISTVIDGANAPTSYAYPLQVPEGATVTLSAETGAVAITAANGTWIGGVAPAWATDAAGLPVATHYELDGYTLIQVVEHDAATTTYPVVADPWLGVGLIDGARWIARDPRGWTLSITPSWFNRINSADGNVIREGWAEVIKRVPSANTTQMYWQYKCHQVFAPFKSTWNLDEWVRRSSYTDSVAHGCN